MLEALDTGDWRAAFHAGAAAGRAPQVACPHVLGHADAGHPCVRGLSTAPFDRDDVARAIALVPGRPHEAPWLGLLELRDGRYAALRASCCGAGWECHVEGDAFVSLRLGGVLFHGLGPDDRRRLELPGAVRLRAFGEAADPPAPIELRKLAVPTPTVATAAHALGVPVETIVKTLVYVTKEGDVVLAIASGLARVSATAVSALLCGLGKLRLASPPEVARAVGYEAGAVPPVGHEPRPRAVAVDRAVLDRPLVWGGGGELDAMAAIAPADIVRLASATVGDIREGD